MISFKEKMYSQAVIREENIRHARGTYVCAYVSAKSRRDIQKWVETHHISNPAHPKQYHTTIIYSRKGVPDVKSYNFDLPIIGQFADFDIFMSGDKRCLVAKVDSRDLHHYHNDIMQRYGATHDFDDYAPHVTLSYDYVGPVPNDPLDVELTYTTIGIEPLDLEYSS